MPDGLALCFHNTWNKQVVFLVTSTAFPTKFGNMILRGNSEYFLLSFFLLYFSWR